QILKPSLQAQDLHFVGLDVIGDYVTEINVTSPTCVRQISSETGLDIAGDYLDFLTELLG
ncbi:MAG: glutathione synthase, partial [Gammaproteobacteria bacterium]|nr:glutathione synthase [Gammaproteobacteria bacterium]